MIFVQLVLLLYPFVKKDFALLKTAVSFGDGYGPKIVKQKGQN